MPDQPTHADESSDNPISVLEKLTGSSWKNLEVARKYTFARREELRKQLEGLDSSDASIVVFGSLARDEATPSSDTDWTFLVDGTAVPEHVDLTLEAKRRLEKLKLKGPGREGTFGELAFSHEILHRIGGEDDSNANTTRRMLLLLESKPIGNAEAWNRVINNVLSRYLKEDRGLWNKSKQRSVPLFLLNDISRYWRTMVVDFAYKQRSRGNEGYALRSIKLGLSRKLTFAAGLLACYSCRLDIPEEKWKEMSSEGNPQPLIEHLRRNLNMTPLEALASRLIRYKEVLGASKRLFDSYNNFIGMLADEAPSKSGEPPRKHLEKLSADDLETDETFQSAREMRVNFAQALKELFLEPKTELYNLTIDFGVF
jgi:predicted nucleotidyltransferase